MIEEGNNQLHGQVLDAQRGDFDMMIVGGKRQQQPVGIAIGMDGCLTAAFDAGQILDKELIETT
jgi:glucose/arabinose dehydrogenase